MGWLAWVEQGQHQIRRQAPHSHGLQHTGAYLERDEASQRLGDRLANNDRLHRTGRGLAGGSQAGRAALQGHFCCLFWLPSNPFLLPTLPIRPITSPGEIAHPRLLARLGHPREYAAQIRIPRLQPTGYR